MRTLFAAVLVLVAAATARGIECVEPVGGATVFVTNIERFEKL